MNTVAHALPGAWAGRLASATKGRAGPGRAIIACLALSLAAAGRGPAAAEPPVSASADYSDQARTVQFQVGPLLNARLVTTLSNDALIAWNKGIDEKWSGLATRAAADAMGSQTRIALPNDGLFPPNSFHPQATLHFSNADASGSQVHFTARQTADSYSFETGNEAFSHLSLFFMSAFGASQISVEIAYADNTKETRNYSVEDWASKIPETNEKYFLAANLAKWGPKNTELEKDRHYIMGINLKPDPTKPVARVTINKPASATSLSFWGATGYRPAGQARVRPGNAAEISYEGRTVVTSGGVVRLGYPGIVIRVNFRGTGLSLRARASSDELYLDVSLDGGEARFLNAPKGVNDIALAANLPAGEHHVEIFKRVETSVGILDVLSWSAEGDFLPATPLPERKLMFLGDSFTAGQATTVEDGGAMAPTKALRQNARLAYGRLLADRFHAQCHIIAYAGRGVMRDWQGIRSARLAPEYYENALPEDPSTRWDPKSYQPDAIGVCLGNNDFGEGVPDQTEYVRIYAEFLRKLRRDAPNAWIFLIVSPSLTDDPDRVPLRTVQRAYLDEIARRVADPRVQVVSISHYAGVQGDWHPSGTAHRAVAKELAPVFSQALKW